MVHHCSPSDRPQGKGATDTDDRKMFRIRSGNPVDGTEGSYAVRNNKSGRPVESRVSICRVRRIEFVAVSDPLRSSAILELLNKLKIEITGYTEDVSNPDLFQSPQQEITDCLFHRFRSSVSRGSQESPLLTHRVRLHRVPRLGCLGNFTDYTSRK